jgi:flagellar biosynthesis protein FlhA
MAEYELIRGGAWIKSSGSHLALGGLALAILLPLLPLPGMALDLLLAAGLALSLSLLLLALTTDAPERLAAFPAALVVTSLGRVGLALALGRATLSGGSSGALVESLGALAGGGEGDIWSAAASLVVVALVAFVVISVGVTRLSEVAARFALDALPGRQMAIDSALTGGRMSEVEGRLAVEQVESQSVFYGAMDGATRFLRGEMIATLLIVGISGLAAAARGGGGESLGEAVLLAVGQGVGLLLPAVLTGAAAAVLVARAGAPLAVGELGQELLVRPALLLAVAVALLVLALAPGISPLPLLLAAGLVGGGAHYARRLQLLRAQETPAHEPPPLQLELGLGLVSLLASGELQETLTTTRLRLSEELGFAVPALAVRDAESLPAMSYRLHLGPLAVGEGELRPGRWLAVASPEGVLPVGGQETVLPDGSPGLWVSESEQREALAASCHLLRPVEVLSLHLGAVIWAQAAELLDGQRVAELVAAVRATHPASVAAWEGSGQSVLELRDLGRALLAEGVALRERVCLLEAVARESGRERDPDRLLERVRVALSRTITSRAAPGGMAQVVRLAPALEEELLAAAQRGAPEGIVALEMGRLEEWRQALRRESERWGSWRRPMVVLCHSECRGALGQMIRQAGLAALAIKAEELLPLTLVQTLHVLQPEALSAPARAAGGEWSS